MRMLMRWHIQLSVLHVAKTWNWWKTRNIQQLAWVIEKNSRSPQRQSAGYHRHQSTVESDKEIRWNPAINIIIIIVIIITVNETQQCLKQCLRVGWSWLGCSGYPLDSFQSIIPVDNVGHWSVVDNAYNMTLEFVFRQSERLVNMQRGSHILAAAGLQVSHTRWQVDRRVVRPDKPQRRLHVIGHCKAQCTTFTDIHVSIAQHVQFARYTTNKHTRTSVIKFSYCSQCQIWKFSD